MNKKFIHLGCEVSVIGNAVSIRKPDGSKESVTLYLTKHSKDFDTLEQTIRDYIDIRFGDTLVQQ
jgi:hypothetical protein